MEKMQYEFSAGAPVNGRVGVGVVGSGDLEVLIDAPDTLATKGQTTLHVTTSVDGMARVWTSLMERIFTDATLPAMHIEINDFGATPGVVRLRIEQAFEELIPSSGESNHGQK